MTLMALRLSSGHLISELFSFIITMCCAIIVVVCNCSLCQCKIIYPSLGWQCLCSLIPRLHFRMLGEWWSQCETNLACLPLAIVWYTEMTSQNISCFSMLIHKLQLHGKDLASFPGSPTSMGMRPEKVHNHVMGKRTASFHDHLHASIKVYRGQTSSRSQSSSCFVGGSGNETVVFQPVTLWAVQFPY